MKTLVIILLALAVLLFLSSAAGLQSKTRFNLIALGLASWALSQLVPFLRNLSVALALFCLVGCASQGTPEQQAARGKNVAALERRGWNVLDVLGRAVESAAIGAIDRQTRGLAK